MGRQVLNMTVVVNEGVLSGKRESGGTHTTVLKDFTVVVKPLEGSIKSVK